MRFYKKATFFFILGLAVGLAISWTSFIESLAILVVSLAKTNYGSWVASLFALCVILIFLLPKLLTSITRVQEKCFESVEKTRKEVIRETVKVVMAELGYDIKKETHAKGGK